MKHFKLIHLLFLAFLIVLITGCAADTVAQSEAAAGGQEAIVEVTLTPVPGPMILFGDDFEDGLDPAWTITGGGWEVVDDGTDNMVLHGINFDPENLPLASVGDNYWANYVLEARIRVVKFEPAQDCGLDVVFLTQERTDCDWYRWSLFAGYEIMSQQFWQDGRCRDIRPEGVNHNFELPVDAWSELQIDVYDNTMRGTINGQLIREFTDETGTAFDTGGVGFLVPASAEVWIDDVRVWAPGM